MECVAKHAQAEGLQDTDTQTHRHTDIRTHTHTHTQTHGHTHTHIHTHTHTVIVATLAIVQVVGQFQLASSASMATLTPSSLPRTALMIAMPISWRKPMNYAMRPSIPRRPSDRHKKSK
eukprot:4697965-Amphidinium_carterae.2